MARETRRAVLWSWGVGLALLAGVVLLAGRSFHWAQLLAVTKRASPAWLAAAVVLQAATYLFQGEVWRAVSEAAGKPLAAATAFRLSLGKLFLDQTLPSAGISGTVFAARALERRGLPRAAAAGCVAVNLVTYYLAYAAALLAAAALAGLHGRYGVRLALAAAAFLVLAAGLTAVFLGARGRLRGASLRKVPPLRRMVDYLERADAGLVRSPRVLGRAGAAQLLIFAADAATVWTLLLAVRAAAPPGPVFGAFMAATVFRSIGLSPGGLGAFEAASVVALHRIGVGVPQALAATLLFRALSFWLPMLPGFWAARGASARA